MLHDIQNDTLCHRHITVTRPVLNSKTYINHLPSGEKELQHIINYVGPFSTAKCIDVPSDIVVRDKYELCHANLANFEYTEMHVSFLATDTMMGNLDKLKLSTLGVSVSNSNNKIHVSLRFRDPSDILDAASLLRGLAFNMNTKLHTEYVVYDTNPSIDSTWLPIHDRLPDVNVVQSEIDQIVSTFM